MKKIASLFLLILTLNSFSQNGYPTCEGLEPACSDNTVVKIFSNVIGQSNQGVFGYLDSSPNAPWFYIKERQRGELAFNIIQNTQFDANGNPTGNGIDLDFIAWGSFNTPDSNYNNLAKDCGVQTYPDSTSDPNFYLNDEDETKIIDSGEDPEDPQILCLNYATPHILEVENPAGDYTYQWTDNTGTILGTDPSLIITQGGEYMVRATDNTTTCARERTIFVKESEKATLQESFITIIDEANTIGSQNNISITISTENGILGKGDYQFAIFNTDNNTRIPSIGFQEEPFFENLEGGVYTIIVNDKNRCVQDETLTISVIQFPKFFTPNGDGKNDTWDIKGANKTFYPNSSINIFDRFGKLVAQVPIDSQGWNGMYNGKILPSNDYWFNIQLIPADINKSTINKKGNFSLLRRK